MIISNINGEKVELVGSDNKYKLYAKYPFMDAKYDGSGKITELSVNNSIKFELKNSYTATTYLSDITFVSQASESDDKTTVDYYNLTFGYNI